MKKGLFNLAFLTLVFLVGFQGVGTLGAAVNPSVKPVPNDYTNKFATGEIVEDIKVLAQQVQKPPKGGSYTDPWTGVKILRVTDVEQNWHRDNNPDWASTQYILHEPLNADNTLVRLTGVRPDAPGTAHHILRAQPPFAYVTSLPIEWGMSPIYPRWSRTDANIIYAVHDGQMKWFNVQTKAHGVVYDFRPHVPDNWSYIGWQDKGDSDVSGRYWPIVCFTHDPERRVRTRTHSHMVFDLQAGQIVDTITMDEDRCIPPLRAAHYPSISSKGNFFWSGGSHGVARLPGFTDIQSLPSAGHADVGLDSEGKEVMVGSSPRRWEGGNASYLYMVDLDTKEIFWLAPINPGFHVSANYPGWAIVSVYSPRVRLEEPYPTGLAWNDRMIYAVELYRGQDRLPMVVPLATVITEMVSYGDAPMANVGKDGSIFFHQNWGTSMTRVYMGEEVQYSGDTFMIPAGWDQGLDPATPHVNHPYPDVLGLSNYQSAPEATVFQVPDIKGLAEAQAEDTIRAEGFRIGGHFYDPYNGAMGVPELTVHKQSPPPNTKVSVLFPDYAYMTYYIAGGIYSLDPADVIEVPDVVGKTVEEATAILEAAGLLISVQLYTVKSDIAAGLVAIQSPRAGGAAFLGNTVDLVLSRGTDPVTPPNEPPPDPEPPQYGELVEIPDVIGMARGLAVRAIQEANLVPAVEYMAVPGFTDYTVANTDPPPGSMVGAGSDVRLTVALAEAPSTNSAPKASFTANPDSGEVPLIIEFDAGASSDPDGDIVSYGWAFGDGVTGGGSTANHTYSAPGVYTVTLEVTDDGGATDSSQTTVIVTDVANQPPEPPVPYSPLDGATGRLLTPGLRTEDFIDSDGDAHALTRWQISTATDFSSLVFDLRSDRYLTSLKVPDSVLSGFTTYYWRARFIDDRGGRSGWSVVYEFRTKAISDDADSNGIPDDQEVDVTVDVDNNGILDVDQMASDPKFKCLDAEGGNVQVAVEGTTNVVSIESIKYVDPATITDKTNKPDDLPFGLLSFKLTTDNPGDSVEVAVYFSESFPAGAKWYKYNSVNGWKDYSAHTTMSADGKSVVLQLKDGGHGDADLVENGIIVDPGGVVVPTATTPTSSEGGSSGSGGGCFIATASSSF